MYTIERDRHAQAGDVVAVSGHAVGEPGRSGEILEVMGEPGHEHFRVRWEDDHESIYYPSSDTVIHAHKPAGRRKS